MWCLSKKHSTVGPFSSFEEANKSEHSGEVVQLTPPWWESFAWIDNSDLSEKTKETAKNILSLFRAIGAYEPSGAIKDDSVFFCCWTLEGKHLEIQICEREVDLFIKTGDSTLLLTT